jgi:hypothetical protein
LPARFIDQIEEHRARAFWHDIRRRAHLFRHFQLIEHEISPDFRPVLFERQSEAALGLARHRVYVVAARASLMPSRCIHVEVADDGVNICDSETTDRVEMIRNSNRTPDSPSLYCEKPAKIFILSVVLLTKLPAEFKKS